MFLYLIVFILFAWMWWRLFFYGLFDDDYIEGFLDDDESNIIFFTADQTNALIATDADGYIRDFNTGDLNARNVKSVSEYMNLIANVGKDFDDVQTELLMQAIETIDEDDLHDDPSGWIDKRKFIEMPWRISLVEGDAYEYGWPHTRQNEEGDIVIILPVNSINKRLKGESRSGFMKELLIHEQMHVYQKTYPDDFQRYLDYHGFRRWGRKTDFPDIAANPDADKWIYERDGEVYCGKYVGKTIRYFPINSPRYDHPREYSVY